MKIVLLGLSAVTAAFGRNAFFNHGPTEKLFPDKATQHLAGEPLHLTKLLQEHGAGAQITKDEAEVHGIGNYTSYAGYFTTKQDTDNNMFMWYFPAQSGDPDAPLLIWLQGGPGGASTFGLFAEMGPLDLTADLEVIDRPTTWNRKYSMLFIDNPVGAGFSYTGTGKGYARNEDDVAADLYELMIQFYQVFPEEKKNDLYITGESYAGHYVPAMGAKIDAENARAPADQFINLKGVAIGDGWVDPINMLPAYPSMLYDFGLCSELQRGVFQDYVDRTIAAIKGGRMREAFEVWDEMLNGDIYPYPNYFHNITGSNNYDNFLLTNPLPSDAYFGQYLNQAEVRKAIHVGTNVMQDGSECEQNLVEDFMVSMIPELVVLLEKYKVIIYSGQLDIIIGAALTERFLPFVPWSLQADYNKVDRDIWYLPNGDPEVAGFTRTVGNFTQAIVRGAGHMVPTDQQERALDMITRFVEGIPFTQVTY